MRPERDGLGGQALTPEPCDDPGKPLPHLGQRVQMDHSRVASRPTQYTFYTREVYNRCMSRVRTNIEIEDTYLQIVMDRYGLRTKTEAVELALRHLAGQPMTREEALAMRGVQAIAEIPDDTRPEGAA